MKSVSSLLNTDCEIYSLCMPSCMLKSITNTYLFKNAFPGFAPFSAAFPKCSQYMRKYTEK